MSRRDVEELIKQLQDAAKDSPDRVTLERSLFDEAVSNLGRLEQALDNRPSLIKKLNEKIIKLEGELEILRNETRVNELEKKVQRLEGELQRSYATKNFTLKNGLLEIEKAYRDFITASPAVQSLWDEITLLLVEDKESLPQHILQRRHTGMSRMEAEVPVVTESPLGPQVAVEDGDGANGPQSTMSYVQQQVDKFKDYTFTPGTHDPHDPNHPANLSSAYSQHHHFPGSTPLSSYGGAPDARAGDAVDDRPTGLDERLTQLRDQYDESSGGAASVRELQPHWGPLLPGPSPLRPVSLFSAGGDGKPPDVFALDACRDELNASLEHLRALFAQYDWAPTPLPYAAGQGQAPPQQQQRQSERRLPDASAFTSMADSLQVSVERLREYFGRMQWAPGRGGGAGAPGGSGAAAAIVPDASYLDAQAEVILASVQHLRQQFQEAAARAAAEAAAATNGGGASGAGSSGGGPAAAGGGPGGSSAAAVVPDARYFENQADAIAASVSELLRLYEFSAAAAADGSGRTEVGNGPWAAATSQAMAAASGIARPNVARTPDARAGEALSEEYDAAVRPLVDLFASFMTHLEATHGSPGASGPWALWRRGAATEGAAAAAAGGGDVSGGEWLQPEAAELIQLFARYARAWPSLAASAAALRTPSRAAASGIGAGSLAAAASMDSLASFPGARPDGELQHRVYGDGAAGPAAAVSASLAPAIRFRIRVDATDAAGGAVTAHLSPAPSASNLADHSHEPQAQRRPAAADADRDADAGAATAADGRTAAAAAPLEVLLTTLEARHGRGLATSPEAVAVWHDLLSLLGIDPSSRPLLTHGSQASTPLRRSASGTFLRAAPLSPQRQGVAAAVAAATDVERGGTGEVTGWAAASGRPAGTIAAGSVPVADSYADAGDGQKDPSTGEVGTAAAAVGLHPEPRLERNNSGSGVQTRNGGAADASVSDGASGEEGFGGEERDARTGSGEGHQQVPGQGSGDGIAAASSATAAEALAMGGEAAEVVWNTLEAPAVGAAEAVPAASAVAAATQGTELAVPAAAESLKPPRGQLDDAVDAGEYGRHQDDGSSPGPSNRSSRSSSRSSRQRVAAAPDSVTSGGAADEAHELREPGLDEQQGGAGTGAGKGAEAGTGASASTAEGEGLGIVAGGVRFQITVSEITPAEEPQAMPAPQQQQQLDAGQLAPLLQFHANVNGVDLEQTAAVEAEVLQLRQIHQSLSEQLAASQDLVRHLNRQLKMTLESRDDLVARTEVLSSELTAARVDAGEARQESDMFMRELVEAKVQLAEVQGEYMQVYLALKKALGNEKDMIAKIDELERILAVVGPGDVSVDEEYGSTVGQVSAMVTPREDYVAGGGAAGSASLEHHTDSAEIPVPVAPQADWTSRNGWEKGGTEQPEGARSGRPSLGDSTAARVAVGATSSDGDSSSGGRTNGGPGLKGSY